MSERFAFIREPEGEALKSLSPIAAKVFIAVRFGRREDETFDLGVRDFKDWSISKDQAARALAELVTAGLLETIKAASFGGKRTRRRLRIAHRRDADQSRERDKPCVGSRNGATVVKLQSRRRDYEAPLQSRQCDISKEAPSPSAQEPKGEGGSASEALREQLRRVEDAAGKLGMSGYALTCALGGPKAANEFSLSLWRGDLTLGEARARLAARKDGLGTSVGGGSGPQSHAASQAERTKPLIFTVGAA